MSSCLSLQHKFLLMYSVLQVYRISCLHVFCYIHVNIFLAFISIKYMFSLYALYNKTKQKFCGFYKENSLDFQSFQKSIFVRRKFLKIRSSINLPWDHVMSPTKSGPDRFSRFDVYWIQTDRQTDRHLNCI